VLDETVDRVDKAERLQQVIGACLGRRSLEPEQTANQDEVLAPRQVLVDG
jgi:hypothetical protein